MDEFEAAELFVEIARSYSPILASKRQRLARRVPEETVWVRADRTRIGQIVSNLISNSSKYSPEGSAIELEVQERSDGLEVVVRIMASAFR